MDQYTNQQILVFLQNTPRRLESFLSLVPDQLLKEVLKWKQIHRDSSVRNSQLTRVNVLDLSLERLRSNCRSEGIKTPQHIPLKDHSQFGLKLFEKNPDKFYVGQTSNHYSHAKLIQISYEKIRQSNSNQVNREHSQHFDQNVMINQTLPDVIVLDSEQESSDSFMIDPFLKQQYQNLQYRMGQQGQENKIKNMKIMALQKQSHPNKSFPTTKLKDIRNQYTANQQKIEQHLRTLQIQKYILQHQNPHKNVDKSQRNKPLVISDQQYYDQSNSPIEKPLNQLRKKRKIEFNQY